MSGMLHAGVQQREEGLKLPVLPYESIIQKLPTRCKDKSKIYRYRG